MILNPWKKKPKPQTVEIENRGSREAESVQAAEFAAAAEQVAAGASEPPPSVEHSPSIVQKLQNLTVSEEHAREAVKACFWPMARYVDPLWALSDVEAAKASPKMQKFLQWLLLKYAPQFSLQLAERFPELLALIVAMATLAWVKAYAVEAAKEERAARAAESPPREAAPVDVAPDLSSGPFFDCELCGRPFISRSELADHLPCNPA